MNSYRVRRATSDDLEQLVDLWNAVQLPALELEKRFTEFQVVEDDQGRLQAAIGFTISAYDAKIHSETYADFGLCDTLRPLLWERLQSVAKNHGLFRLWTDETAPFWKKDAGFIVPDEKNLQKRPQAFVESHQTCFFLQIRDESASPEALERELALHKQAEHARVETLKSRARTIRIIVTIIAALLLIYAIGTGIFYFKKFLPH